MAKLRIAENLALPLDAVTATFAILAIRGAGKTHTASVFAEEMLKAGQPIVAYDPTGAWYGLRSSADGKNAGHPVVVFGGEHADVPLEESAGAVVATAIVEKRFPAILDVSLMRKNARVRFMQDFCETLYHRNREPLHFFVDEAHTVAPQRVFPDAARLLGAMEDILLQGRRRGLGATIISQRPALVNKNITAMCQVLVAMRISGPHDRAAVSEWIDAYGDKEKGKAMLDSLASLGQGDGWVWAPGWGQFHRVHFRARETFDSSATPKVGETARQPKKLASVDVQALGEQIAETVKRAKENDPKELKRRLAELEKQLRDRPATVQTVKEVERVEVPVLKNGQLEKALSIVDRLRGVVEPLTAAIQATKPVAPVVGRPVVARPSPPPRQPSVAKEQLPPPDGRDSLTPSEQAVLDAAASFPSGATRQRIAVYSGRSIKSSSFQSAFPSLEGKGLLFSTGDRYLPTDAGAALAMPNAGASLEDWLAKLVPSEAKVLRCIADAYPERVTREQVSERTGQSMSSSSFQSAFPALRDLELIEGRADFRANETLMGSR